MGSRKEWTALVFATLMTALSLWGVPSWRGALTEVCHVAGILAAVTVVMLHVTRWLGPRGFVIERILSALFLAGMPLVYILSWLARGGAGASSTWLWVEILGFPLYAGLALFGLRRWPSLLAVGIVGHGFLWDSWHYLVHSAYIPDWYSVGCLIADIGIGVYVAVRAPAWTPSRGGNGERP